MLSEGLLVWFRSVSKREAAPPLGRMEAEEPVGLSLRDSGPSAVWVSRQVVQGDGAAGVGVGDHGLPKGGVDVGLRVDLARGDELGGGLAVRGRIQR
ncbi:hypothetical protein [Streptomyces sp. SJL17-1]|uniref:hypothetical protein n=1 Tax=Streptomyces sp. SJL17-1 TaxID=2967223 RepID=UPI0029670ED1|nr:hypothetical protein [Streptomyces sp. SJL17-1]